MVVESECSPPSLITSYFGIKSSSNCHLVESTHLGQTFPGKCRQIIILVTVSASESADVPEPPHNEKKDTHFPSVVWGQNEW